VWPHGCGWPTTSSQAGRTGGTLRHLGASWRQAATMFPLQILWLRHWHDVSKRSYSALIRTSI
jgi:hypothetical protein